jgi:hypothetical protein
MSQALDPVTQRHVDNLAKELDDPAGRDLEAVRRIRDEIDRRVQQLIGELEA